MKWTIQAEYSIVATLVDTNFIELALKFSPASNQFPVAGSGHRSLRCGAHPHEKVKNLVAEP